MHGLLETPYDKAARYKSTVDKLNISPAGARAAAVQLHAAGCPGQIPATHSPLASGRQVQVSFSSNLWTAVVES